MNVPTAAEFRALVAEGQALRRRYDRISAGMRRPPWTPK